jgi:hypothetical protein
VVVKLAIRKGKFNTVKDWVDRQIKYEDENTPQVPLKPNEKTNIEVMVWKLE